ncbi:unnamed protein product [Amoebophrya sp. A25]|nr:unnamed protein product [Amoebophrya sp. A25]|eukprot:GSA25T00009018001.1
MVVPNGSDDVVPFGLVDPTPLNLYRGCQLCPDLHAELVDVFFFDSQDCMWPKLQVAFDAATVVSCTLLSCLAVNLLCGYERTTGENPAKNVLLELPRFFADHLHLMLTSAGGRASVEQAGSPASGGAGLSAVNTIRVATRMRELVENFAMPNIRAFTDTYGTFSPDVKNHANGLLAPEMLRLVESVVHFRRLFQWQFNFLNVGCHWDFMDACSRIRFEDTVSRFYRVKVVTDLLLSMWRDRIAATGSSGDSDSVINTHPLNASRYQYLNEKEFPSNGISIDVPDSLEHGLNSAQVQGTSLRFVEVGVFQGRLAYSVLNTCAFVEYHGVDPYFFETGDFEFQGLFTDKLEEKALEVEGDDSGASREEERSRNRAGENVVDRKAKDDQAEDSTSSSSSSSEDTTAARKAKFDFAKGMLEARDGARQKIGFYGNRARLIEKQSRDAVDQFEDESVDLVFIDADHRYDSTLEDIRLWYPKVRKGGVVGGHDFGNNPEVTKAVLDFVHQNCKAGQIINADSDWVWYFVKT